MGIYIDIDIHVKEKGEKQMKSRKVEKPVFTEVSLSLQQC